MCDEGAGWPLLFDYFDNNYYSKLSLVDKVKRMNPKDVVEYFGSQTAAAKALGTFQPEVSRWVKMGYVPRLRQYQIEKLTRGKLKVSEEVK